MTGCRRAHRHAGGTRRPLGWALGTCVLLLLAVPAAAQLSPGPLSRAHADLDGVKNCNRCHKLGDREIGPKCLECHTEIAAMRAGGTGLHAAPDHAECAACHVEHQGEDFALVHWPQGQENFDHTLAGYPLTGAHAKLDCRKCHNVKNVEDPGALRTAGKDPDRTFLGLPQACAACHGDPHRGQLARDGAPRACTDCHDTAAWKPAPGFDHARAAYTLTGRHEQVDCARCHPVLPATAGPHPQPATPRFRPLDFAACLDCHKDPHAGTLGRDCTQCHSTAGWKQIVGKGFDHARTRYPLEGRHAQVRCQDCHGQERAKPAFAACTDCHRDAHGARAAGRPALLACERCHTVQGFRPAAFDLAAHDTTAFPLQAAHRAVPCLLCHTPAAAAVGRPAPYDRAGELVPAHAACTDCHADPHGGQAAAFFARVAPDAADAGCTACHDQASWRTVAFDHARTAFPLDGRHRGVPCGRCHKPAEGAAVPLPLAGAPRLCAGCHEDAHKGMFADRTAADGVTVACDRCHVTTDWLAERFDHDRDSRFPLRGGHEKVACRTCHPPLDASNERLLKFKPVPVECRACHVNDPKVQGGTP